MGFIVIIVFIGVVFILIKVKCLSFFWLLIWGLGIRREI